MFSYCIYCHTGYEKDIACKLEKLYSGCRAIAPVRLIEERRNSIWKTVERCLFPGYVFLYSEQRVDFSFAKTLKNYYKTLRYHNNIHELQGTDCLYAEWILSNNGKIGISTIISEGDTVRVTGGPLADNCGRIIKLYRHKRRAIVVFSFDGIERQVSLTVIDLTKYQNSPKQSE